MFLRSVRGDELIFDVTVTADIEGFDLRNFKIYFTMKTLLTSPNAPILRKSKADGGIVVLSPKVCRVVLTSADTGGLPNQSFIYKFDVIIRDDEGVTFTVLSGDLEIRASTAAPAP